MARELHFPTLSYTVATSWQPSRLSLGCHLVVIWLTKPSKTVGIKDADCVMQSVSFCFKKNSGG
nr:MAG TPA: hypothetical protein [Caudoviricetes sp.]